MNKLDNWLKPKRLLPIILLFLVLYSVITLGYRNFSLWAPLARFEQAITAQDATAYLPLFDYNAEILRAAQAQPGRLASGHAVDYLIPFRLTSNQELIRQERVYEAAVRQNLGMQENGQLRYLVSLWCRYERDSNIEISDLLTYELQLARNGWRYEIVAIQIYVPPAAAEQIDEA